MGTIEAVVEVVQRVTGRVRMWRLLQALVRAGLWCVGPAFVLVLIDKFVHIPWPILMLPVAAFVVLFAVWQALGLSGVNRFEVAKRIDDEVGLQDRLTSALYFEKLKFTDGLVRAAIDDANVLARQVDVSKVWAGQTPRFAIHFAVAALITLGVAVGPVTFKGLFGAKSSTKAGTMVAKTDTTQSDDATAAGGQSSTAKPLDRNAPAEGVTKLETEKTAPRDPSTMDTTMTPEIEAEIQNIKASLNPEDLKGMEDAFKDDKKKDSKGEKDEKPVKMAPLDKELLDDIARAKKEKAKEGEGSDDAIGVAVKMPAPPGAKAIGPRMKGGGGHGGGDVGESGDTRGAPRRVPIAGRDKLVVESKHSGDVLEKSKLEQEVMTELVMRLSMKDVTMTGTATDVKAEFGPVAREAVVEETVPLGFRGFVQRYFEGIGPKPSAAPAESPGKTTENK
jgi:hypothetical protein